MGYLGSYRWAFGFDHAMAALSLQPVIVGTNWYEAMTYPNPDGRVDVAGDSVGGHEYALLGINVRGQYFTALNSWGSNWGDNGRFRIGFSDMESLLDDHGDVAVPMRKG